MIFCACASVRLMRVPACVSKLKIAHVLIFMCFSLSVCWCWSDYVCGSPAGRNCVCGTKTFSFSVTDRTTVTPVRSKNNRHKTLLMCRLLCQLCSPLTLLFAHKLINVVIVIWHFAGITALIELPKNCIAAAMDKEIGKREISDHLL